MTRVATSRPSAPRVAGPALIAALALCVLGGTHAPRAARAGEAARDTTAYSAPDWTLRTADGGEVSLHGALARGPVLVSFWALWCVPCLRELPHLDELARETAGRLTVLAVNEDGPRSVARVRPYVHSRRLGLIVPLDTPGDVAREMQIGDALPFLVLYDARGHETYRRVGYREGDEVALRARVMELLGAVSPDTSAAR